MLVDTYASQTSHPSYPLSRIQGQRIGSLSPTRRIDCRRCTGPWPQRQRRAQVARRHWHETLRSALAGRGTIANCLDVPPDSVALGFGVRGLI